MIETALDIHGLTKHTNSNTGRVLFGYHGNVSKGTVEIK